MPIATGKVSPFTKAQRARIRNANGLLTQAIGILQEIRDAIWEADGDADELPEILNNLEDAEGALETLAPSDEA